MISMRAVYHLVRADFLERSRRRSFLIVMAATVCAGYLMVPPRQASYNAFVIAGHRGYYNSPWVGTVFGVVAATLLTLLGFYLVRDSVARDYVTRVGQIVATTPISKPVYILGKWLSNLLVLAAILAVLTGMAAVMLLVRAESGDLDLVALAVPIWFMGLPTVGIVAALAVLFESIPFLRGGAGNVVYFFFWGVVLMLTVARIFISVGDITPHNDLAGLSGTMVDIRQQMVAAGVDISRGATDLGVPTRGRDTARFLWDGVDWSPEVFLARSIWLVLAAAIALSASLPFDRFDPTRGKADRLSKKAPSSDSPGFFERLSETVAGTFESGARGTTEWAEFPAEAGLTPLTRPGVRARWWPLLVAELRLTVRGQKWWWFVVALGLVIASLFSPQDVVHRYLFPAAWLWPIVCWSALGNREARYRTAPVVFSTPHLVRRQLLATWLGGLLLAVATGSGAGLRLVIAGQWGHVLAFGIAAVFIPSLALALGVWSGGGRLFEVLYVLWWYLGSIDRVPALDYMGIGPRSVSDSHLVVYFVVSVLLCCVAAVGRRRQLQT